MTHSPAPWKIHTEKGKIGILTENNVDHLATCYGFRKEQNARLIAAAPELLAALRGLMTQAAKDAEGYAPDDSKAIWAWIADASDAIAKAEGKA